MYTQFRYLYTISIFKKQFRYFINDIFLVSFKNVVLNIEFSECFFISIFDSYHPYTTVTCYTPWCHYYLNFIIINLRICKTYFRNSSNVIYEISIMLHNWKHVTRNGKYKYLVFKTTTFNLQIFKPIGRH